MQNTPFCKWSWPPPSKTQRKHWITCKNKVQSCHNCGNLVYIWKSLKCHFQVMFLGCQKGRENFNKLLIKKGKNISGYHRVRKMVLSYRQELQTLQQIKGNKPVNPWGCEGKDVTFWWVSDKYRLFPLVHSETWFKDGWANRKLYWSERE